MTIKELEDEINELERWGVQEYLMGQVTPSDRRRMYYLYAVATENKLRVVDYSVVKLIPEEYYDKEHWNYELEDLYDDGILERPTSRTFRCIFHNYFIRPFRITRSRLSKKWRLLTGKLKEADYQDMHLSVLKHQSEREHWNRLNNLKLDITEKPKRKGKK